MRQMHGSQGWWCAVTRGHGRLGCRGRDDVAAQIWIRTRAVGECANERPWSVGCGPTPTAQVRGSEAGSHRRQDSLGRLPVGRTAIVSGCVTVVEPIGQSLCLSKQRKPPPLLTSLATGALNCTACSPGSYSVSTGAHGHVRRGMQHLSVQRAGITKTLRE